MRAEPQYRINKRALKVWRISALFSVAILTLLFIGYIFVSSFFDFPKWIATSLLAILLIYAAFRILFMPKIRWNRWRYEVFEQEIDIQYGKWVVRRVLIPMVRVQHVDTYQGPLLRKYHLASVAITTAATIHEIPALDVEEADKLRDMISRLARVVEEDV